MELELTLIRDTKTLEGTCYFEFLPGKFKNKCWNQQSVFLSEDAYELVEECFSRDVDRYDHYAFMEADRETIEKITQCLDVLAAKIENVASLKDLLASMRIGEYQRSELEAGWPETKQPLKMMVRELSQWLRDSILGHEVVSILGM